MPEKLTNNSVEVYTWKYWPEPVATDKLVYIKIKSSVILFSN